MNHTENPYQPPNETESIRVGKATNWRWFGWLNIGLVGALASLILSSYLWNRFEEARIRQQFGRRFATYDHEYEFYPAIGLVVIALIFAVPNLVFFALHFARRDRKRK